jgi:hypothetical protein
MIGFTIYINGAGPHGAFFKFSRVAESQVSLVLVTTELI